MSYQELITLIENGPAAELSRHPSYGRSWLLPGGAIVVDVEEC
jgi:hypothetical protein